MLPILAEMELMGFPHLVLVELMHVCCSSPVSRQTGSSSRDSVKRPDDHSSNFSSDSSRHQKKASHVSKPGAAAPSETLAKPPKSGTKPGAKVAKTSSGKTTDTVGDR